MVATRIRTRHGPFPPALLALSVDEADAVEAAPADEAHDPLARLVDGHEDAAQLLPEPGLPRRAPHVGQFLLETLGTLDGRVVQQAGSVAVTAAVGALLDGLGAADVTAQDAAVLDAGVAPVVQQLRVARPLAHPVPDLLVDAHLDVPPRGLLQRHPAAEVRLVARQYLVAPRAVPQLILWDPAVCQPEDQ